MHNWDMIMHYRWQRWLTLTAWAPAIVDSVSIGHRWQREQGQPWARNHRSIFQSQSVKFIVLAWTHNLSSFTIVLVLGRWETFILDWLYSPTEASKKHSYNLFFLHVSCRCAWWWGKWSAETTNPTLRADTVDLSRRSVKTSILIGISFHAKHGLVGL